MPGLPLQLTALVIGRQPSSADAFEQLTTFDSEHGVLHCLRRISGKAVGHATPLDLFDEAELWLESANEGRTWFIKEHRHVKRHPGLGRSYDALRAAADLAALITRNPVPDESRATIAALLRQTLGALDAGSRPDIVWFKTLYCFLRDEGYPVKQDWWPQLTAADRDAAAQILNQPIAQQDPASELVARLTRRLAEWITGETDLRLPR